MTFDKMHILNKNISIFQRKVQLKAEARIKVSIEMQKKTMLNAFIATRRRVWNF